MRKSTTNGIQCSYFATDNDLLAMGLAAIYPRLVAIAVPKYIQCRTDKYRTVLSICPVQLNDRGMEGWSENSFVNVPAQVWVRRHELSHPTGASVVNIGCSTRQLRGIFTNGYCSCRVMIICQ